MPANLIRQRAGKPQFIQPYLHALDRMQQRVFLRPDELTEQARLLLSERLGTTPDPIEAAFAHGSTGLLGEHTHYFDGFALLLVLPLGAAVAVRRTEAACSSIVFEGSEAVWSFDRTQPVDEAVNMPGWPGWVRLVEQLARRMAPADAPGQIEAAVVSTVSTSSMDAYLSALGVAAARAFQALFALPTDTRDVLSTARDAVSASMQLPFSIAYLRAAEANRADVFALVDTATFEQILLDMPGRDVLGWGIVDVGTGPQHEFEFFRKRKAAAEEVVDALQRAFPNVASLRDLEHRDLQQAIEVVPRRLRPVLRHLVTENRRVQKMVVAIRQRDWQMFGALLLMSHASQRNDWESSREEIDLVVEQVERMSIDGMYGACMTSRSGCVLMTGQPFIVPRCLDQIVALLGERFDISPEIVLL